MRCAVVLLDTLVPFAACTSEPPPPQQSAAGVQEDSVGAASTVFAASAFNRREHHIAPPTTLGSASRRGAFGEKQSHGPVEPSAACRTSSEDSTATWRNGASYVVPLWGTPLPGPSPRFAKLRGLGDGPRVYVADAMPGWYDGEVRRRLPQLPNSSTASRTRFPIQAPGSGCMPRDDREEAPQPRTIGGPLVYAVTSSTRVGGPLVISLATTPTSGDPPAP